VVWQVAGAILRAFMMVVLVALPALLLPHGPGQSAQLITLLALFLGALTFAEYATAYPALVEFRYAPPFNRLRFMSLLLMVASLPAVMAPEIVAGSTGEILPALAGALGTLMDYPYTPVRMMVIALADPADPTAALRIRDAAALSFVVGGVTVLAFALTILLTGWPLRRRRFNVWINLPTFDPSMGHDVVQRLDRDALFNMALGLFLPFLFPALLRLLGAASIGSLQASVWMVAGWTFLSVSLLMRGMAMARIARLIRETRRTAAAAGGSAYQTA
jgi:hypothetical protein